MSPVDNRFSVSVDGLESEDIVKLLDTFGLVCDLEEDKVLIDADSARDLKSNVSGFRKIKAELNSFVNVFDMFEDPYSNICCKFYFSPKNFERIWSNVSCIYCKTYGTRYFIRFFDNLLNVLGVPHTFDLSGPRRGDQISCFAKIYAPSLPRLNSLIQYYGKRLNVLFFVDEEVPFFASRSPFVGRYLETIRSKKISRIYFSDNHVWVGQNRFRGEFVLVDSRPYIKTKTQLIPLG